MVIYFAEPVFNNNSPVIFFLRIQRVGKEVVLPPRKLPGKSGWKVEFIPAPDGPGEQIQFDLAVPGGRSKACHGVCTNKPPSVTKQNAKIRIDHDPSRQGREKGFKKNVVLRRYHSNRKAHVVEDEGQYIRGIATPQP